MQINPSNFYQSSRPEIMGGDNPSLVKKNLTREEEHQSVDQDRVDIVCGQNFAATQTESLDIESAFQLLDGVNQDLANLTGNDISQLYHYDNLRQVFSR